MPAAGSSSRRTPGRTSAATASTATSIARTLHGFKPQWTARSGVEQLYEAFKRVGLTLDDFEGERFKRIAHIKKLIGARRRWIRACAGSRRRAALPEPRRGETT